MLEYLFISFLIGVTAIVFTEVLLSPGMILDFYARWLDKLPDWLAYPLGGCVFCFAGQLALWVYLFCFWNVYNLFYHVAFICLSIFWTLIHNKWK